MTTKVTVEANHGWPVRVKTIVVGGATYERDDVIVEANTTQVFYVHSTQDLLIHEVQPDEIDGSA